MNNNFIYTDTMVRFYDIVTKDMARNDKNFYQNEIIKTSGKVLEIGTGTGRNFIPAINQGADIYGIDISRNMMNYLKKRIKPNEHSRIKFADIRNFDFGFKFELIIAPFNMFLHLLTIDDQLSALRNIYSQLSAGGVFIFDVFVPDLERVANGSNETLRFEGEYEPGKCFKWYDSAKPDYFNQTSHVSFKYVWEENGMHEEIIEFPFRYLFRFELEHLIARSGLQLEKMYGDFNYGELNSQSKNFVSVCKRN